MFIFLNKNNSSRNKNKDSWNNIDERFNWLHNVNKNLLIGLLIATAFSCTQKEEKSTPGVFSLILAPSGEYQGFLQKKGSGEEALYDVSLGIKSIKKTDKSGSTIFEEDILTTGVINGWCNEGRIKFPTCQFHEIKTKDSSKEGRALWFAVGENSDLYMKEIKTGEFLRLQKR